MLMNWLRSLFGGSKQESPSMESSLAEKASRSLVIRQIFSHLETFADTTAKEVMTPRVDITAIPVDMPIEELLKLIQDTGHSRYPVYEQSIDQIVGVLNVKDLFQHMGKLDRINLRKLARKAMLIPESKSIDDLFVSLKANRTHMAIVVDEYGGVAGLVTMENILEELVGEIQDEYDHDEEDMFSIAGGEYRVNSRMNLEDFAAAIDIPLSSDDNDTVGGYVQHLLGRIPEVGDEVESDGLLYRVEEMDGNRLQWLKISISPAKPASSEEDGESSNESVA